MKDFLGRRRFNWVDFFTIIIATELLGRGHYGWAFAAIFAGLLLSMVVEL